MISSAFVCDHLAIGRLPSKYKMFLAISRIESIFLSSELGSMSFFRVPGASEKLLASSD
jgi:hypothetical protein